MTDQKPKPRSRLNPIGMMLGMAAAASSRPKPSDKPAGESMSVRDQKKKQRNRVMDKIQKKSRKINYQRAKR